MLTSIVPPNIVTKPKVKRIFHQAAVLLTFTLRLKKYKHYCQAKTLNITGYVTYV